MALSVLLALLTALSQVGATLTEIPVISMTAAEDENEVVVGPRFTPDVFQYRITKTRESTRYPPWVSDETADRLMSRETTCAQYLSSTRVRFRGEIGEVQEIPLVPVPLEQTFVPANTKLRTDFPGINRNRLSSCCDRETCTDRCLVFPQGETWFLEIIAPSWAVYRLTDGYQQEDVAFGLSITTPTARIIQADPGLWPVMRIPCLYCPIKSCLTNCSNGEYATGYADFSVRTPRHFFRVA